MEIRRYRDRKQQRVVKGIGNHIGGQRPEIKQQNLPSVAHSDAAKTQRRRHAQQHKSAERRLAPPPGIGQRAQIQREKSGDDPRGRAHQPPIAGRPPLRPERAGAIHKKKRRKHRAHHQRKRGIGHIVQQPAELRPGEFHHSVILLRAATFNPRDQIDCAGPPTGNFRKCRRPCAPWPNSRCPASWRRRPADTDNASACSAPPGLRRTDRGK
ncbi:hypothetical protein SDC9_117152 [bioreactor metagenome]|uniref:Uncharacterized protein n=1 Tax=bioreactor metagenome TaxID=1076179 RepID=A0A645BXU8_9ZZZZ